MYYTCGENKGADQLRGDREADLRLCFKCWFSHDAAHLFLSVIMYCRIFDNFCQFVDLSSGLIYSFFLYYLRRFYENQLTQIDYILVVKEKKNWIKFS